MIMIHGAGGGAWEWNVWRGVFEAEGFACEVLDVAAVEGGIGATRFENYSGQVGRVAREGDVLVGASLGGLLALACPPAVRPAALVLVNAMPPGPTSSTSSPRQIRNVPSIT